MGPSLADKRSDFSMPVWGYKEVATKLQARSVVQSRQCGDTFESVPKTVSDRHYFGDILPLTKAKDKKDYLVIDSRRWTIMAFSSQNVK